MACLLGFSDGGDILHTLLALSSIFFIQPFSVWLELCLFLVLSSLHSEGLAASFVGSLSFDSFLFLAPPALS